MLNRNLAPILAGALSAMVRLLPAIVMVMIPAVAAPEPQRHVWPTLVAEDLSIRPGEPFWVGLHLETAPGWHTYWKNPGDSGLATRLAWKLPDGFSAGPLVWPHPERMASGPLVSYGYPGEVLLLVEMTPAPTVPTGATLTLAARADWLECAEECLPGRADLTLDLPVLTDRPQPNATFAQLFDRSRRRVPAPARDWGVSARGAPTAITLAIRPPTSALTEIDTAYFYAEDPEVIDYAACQPLSRNDTGVRLDLTRAANSSTPATALRGVLVLTANGQESRAIQVDVPIGN